MSTRRAAAVTRRAASVDAAIGVNGYVGHLAWQVFAHSMIFSFVLSGMGIAMIFAAVKYTLNRGRIETAVRRWFKR